MSRSPRIIAAVLSLTAVLCLAVAGASAMFPGDALFEMPAEATLQASSLPRGPQDPAQTGEVHEWRIVARKYSYSESRLEVRQNDLVKITFEAADIPHSFTIDEPYRIAKRAAPGHPVVFEFRADKVGTFDFYCSLKTDDGCRKMKGQLIVSAR